MVDQLLTYLVDDRGENGEYLHFLRAHGDRLQELELEVVTNWVELRDRMSMERPELILLDMQFDQGAVRDLCGDLNALASSARFGGDVQRAEAQLRRLQGVFILQALRGTGFRGPIVLFGTLPEAQAERLLSQYGPLRIVEGLLYEGVREALTWARACVDSGTSPT